ncbi:MAG: hypothetical protein JNK05_28545 [Myxococcales bacterium]|nr:hypothetical protein [Myxococcales bacterium]
MPKRPDSILGLALYYAKLRLSNPKSRGSALLAFGLVGAAVTSGVAGLAMRANGGGCPHACNRASRGAIESLDQRAAPVALPSQLRRTCQTMAVRASDQHATVACLPQWAWGSLATRTTGEFVRPRDGQSISLLPSLASNGDGYGLVYTVLTERNADVYFQRVSSGGERVGNAVRVTQSGDGELALFPSVAWTGSGYAIAWTGLKNEEELDVYLARVDASGTPQGANVKVSESREMDLFARVAVSNGRTSVGWVRFNGEDQMSARFRFYDSAGSRVGNELGIRDVLIVGMPTLLPTRQGFAFGYNTFDLRRAQSQLTLYRMGPEGQSGAGFVVNAERKINAAVAMAADGDAFNFAWEDGMFEEETNTLAFARASGNRVEQRRTALTNGRAIDMQPAAAVGSDGNTGVTWTHADPRSGRPTVVFARVGKNGRVVGELVRMPRAGADALFSSVAWGGREYLLAWTEVAGESASIALGRVSVDGRRP